MSSTNSSSRAVRDDEANGTFTVFPARGSYVVMTCRVCGTSVTWRSAGRRNGRQASCTPDLARRWARVEGWHLVLRRQEPGMGWRCPDHVSSPTDRRARLLYWRRWLERHPHLVDGTFGVEAWPQWAVNDAYIAGGWLLEEWHAYEEAHAQEQPQEQAAPR